MAISNISGIRYQIIPQNRETNVAPNDILAVSNSDQQYRGHIMSQEINHTILEQSIIQESANEPIESLNNNYDHPVQQIAQQNILASRYKRLAYSMINVTMTIVIIISLLVPVLTIPTIIVGTVATCVLFGISKAKANNNYCHLSQDKLNKINKDNFTVTKKVISYLMLASLLLITVSVFFCVVTIPVLSSFIIPIMPTILLAIFLSKIILDTAMQYLSNRELNQQIKNIDYETANLLQTDDSNAIQTEVDHLSDYRQFLIDQSKNTTLHTVLEILCSVRILAMSIVSIAGAILLPITPFVMLAFAVIFIVIAIIHEVYVRSNHHFIKPDNRTLKDNDLLKIHEIKDIENKYSNATRIIKAITIAAIFYSTMVSIPVIASFIGISATMFTVFSPICISLAISIAITGIVLLFVLEKRRTNLIEKLSQEIEYESLVTTEQSIVPTSTSQKSNLYNKIWAVNLIPFIGFNFILLLTNLAFFCTPFGIAIICGFALWLMVGNLVIIHLSRRKRNVLLESEYDDNSVILS